MPKINDDFLEKYYIVWSNGEVSFHEPNQSFYFDENFVLIGEITGWKVSIDTPLIQDNLVPVQPNDIVAPFLMLNNRLKVKTVQYYKGMKEKYY